MNKVILAVWALLLPSLAFAQSRLDARLVFTSDTFSRLQTPELFEVGSEEVVKFSIYYRGKVAVGYIKPRAKSLLKYKSGLPVPALFKGRLTRVKGGNFNVAATLFDGNLTINFTNGRDVFSSTFDVSQQQIENTYFGVIHRVPSFVKVDSGFVINSTGNHSYSTQAASSQGTYEIEISAVTDEQYVTIKGGEAEAHAQILSTINTAETIYSGQLSATFSVVAQSVVPSGSFTSSDSNVLLNQFLAYENSSDSTDRDIGHLFTGRNLDGSTIGLAYLGVMCVAPTFSYGLTQMRNNESLAGLTFAHEVGHNLGASHDDATPSLMSSAIDPSHNSFSSFSLAEINAQLDDDSSCLNTSGGSGSATYSIGKASLSQGGKFKLVSNLTSGDATNCTIYIYGSTKEGKLSNDNILAEGTLIASFIGTLGSTKTTTTGMPSSLKKEKIAKFKLVVNCGDDGTSYSSIKNLTISDGGSVGLKSWLNTLQNKAFSIISK